MNEPNYKFYKPSSDFQTEFFYALGAKDKFEEAKIKQVIQKVLKDLDPAKYEKIKNCEKIEEELKQNTGKISNKRQFQTQVNMQNIKKDNELLDLDGAVFNFDQ